MPYFTSDGANIHLDVAGDGPPLLLLHGFTLDHRQWEPQRAALSREHRVLAMDLRGHGRSATGLGGYTYAAMARDVTSALVQAGMERLHPGYVVAHSLSADAALQSALAEPRLLKGVVVVTPAVWGHSWSEDWTAMWRGMCAEARTGRLEAALERFRDDAIFDGVRHLEAMGNVREMQSVYSGAHLRAAEKEAGQPTLERLPGLKVPLLVVSAERDRADFRATSREICERAPAAQQVEIAGSGHFPNLERPAEFKAIVQEFLQALS